MLRRRLRGRVNNHQPLAVRILHWAMALVFLTLAVTGVYIHHPLRSAELRLMGLARHLHLAMAYPAAIVFAMKLIYDVGSGNWRHLLPRWRDPLLMPAQLAYFFLLRRRFPIDGKYNPGERLTFTFWIPAMAFSIYTGFLIDHPRGPVPEEVRWLGGFGAVRLWHYLSGYLLAAGFLMHIYAAIVEDPAKLKAMVTGTLERPRTTGTRPRQH